jgi:hypothetical protein
MLSPVPLARRAGSIGHEAIRYGWPGWLRPLLRELTEKPGIREVLPGVHHWTRVHPRIRAVVRSYYVEPAGVVIGPLIPREGLEWFEDRRRPEQVVLTIRHHPRDGERFAEAFGCELRCHVDGLHEFADGPDVQGFHFGDELAPGVTALDVDAISPDETALHLDYGGGAISFGDGVTRPGGGPLRFVPDFSSETTSSASGASWPPRSIGCSSSSSTRCSSRTAIRWWAEASKLCVSSSPLRAELSADVRSDPHRRARATRVQSELFARAVVLEEVALARDEWQRRGAAPATASWSST